MFAISFARTFFGITESALARLGLFELARATVGWESWFRMLATLERFNLTATSKKRKGPTAHSLPRDRRFFVSLCPISGYSALRRPGLIQVLHKMIGKMVSEVRIS